MKFIVLQREVTSVAQNAFVTSTRSRCVPNLGVLTFVHADADDGVVGHEAGSKWLGKIRLR